MPRQKVLSRKTNMISCIQVDNVRAVRFALTPAWITVPMFSACVLGHTHTYHTVFRAAPRAHTSNLSVSVTLDAA
eukprot:m.1012052 g.1012052  ORF g.1012052 m.1012052 type:complete len:75 (-) comp24065_c0_seq4:814-1038(-)